MQLIIVLLVFDTIHILGVSTTFLNLKQSILECPLKFIHKAFINDFWHIMRPILQYLRRYFEVFCVLAFVWPFWPKWPKKPKIWWHMSSSFHLSQKSWKNYEILNFFIYGLNSGLQKFFRPFFIFSWLKRSCLVETVQIWVNLV